MCTQGGGAKDEHKTRCGMQRSPRSFQRLAQSSGLHKASTEWHIRACLCLHSCRAHLGSACPPQLEVPAPSTVPPSPAAAAAAASPAAGPATKSAGCSSARWRSHHCSTPTALTGLHGIVGQSPKTQLLHNKCRAQPHFRVSATAISRPTAWQHSPHPLNECLPARAANSPARNEGGGHGPGAVARLKSAARPRRRHTCRFQSTC